MKKLTLELVRQKTTSSRVTGPVVLMFETPELDDNGKTITLKTKSGEEYLKRTKQTVKLGFGETFEVEAQTGYEIIAKYKGLVQIHEPKKAEVKAAPAAPANKMLKDEATK